MSSVSAGSISACSYSLGLGVTILNLSAHLVVSSAGTAATGSTHYIGKCIVGVLGCAPPRVLHEPEALVDDATTAAERISAYVTGERH